MGAGVRVLQEKLGWGVRPTPQKSLPHLRQKLQIFPTISMP